MTVSMRLRIAASAALALCSSVQAGGEHGSLRDLAESDVAAWSRLYGSPMLSADGKWFVYVSSGYDDTQSPPRKGMPQLIVRATDSAFERRVNLGELPAEQVQAKMSGSGRWVAYMKAGVAADRASVAVMDMNSGKDRTLVAGEDFQFSVDERWLLIKQSTALGGDYSLSLHRLNAPQPGSVAPLHWSGVREHAFDSSGRHLALITVQGVRLLDLRSRRERSLESPLSSSLLRWSPSGRALAMVHTVAGEDGLVVFSNIGAHDEHKQVFMPSRWKRFPSGFQIKTRNSWSSLGPLLHTVLRWRDAEDGLFFNIEPAPGMSAGSTIADLLIWHTQDPWIPADKAAGNPESYLSYLSLPDGGFVRLADEIFSNVLPQGRGRHALGFSWRSYGVNNAGCASNIFPAPQKRDYALVDLKTGQRSEIAAARGLMAYCKRYWPTPDGRFSDSGELEPQLSPDGSAFLYLDSTGNFQVYDTGHGTHSNVTGAVPGWSPQTSLAMDQQPRLAGWTADGRYALMSDNWDFWALPLKGGRAFNLTGNGRSSGIRYFYFDLFAGAPGNRALGSPALTSGSHIDLKHTLYFGIDANSLRNGLAVWRPGQKSAEVLTLEDAELRYYKARDADVYIASRQTADTGGPVFFRLDDRWRPARQLTDLWPQQTKFRWPTAQILNRTSVRDSNRFALLFTPPGAVSGAPYPTIVHVYATVRGYQVHSSNDVYSPEAMRRLRWWLQRGYAVLEPNLPYRINDPGVNALERTQEAVEAAIATGWVDRNRLGLYGHSYGGFETMLIVSQTDLFKVAVSVAGISDLKGYYNNAIHTIPASPINALGSDWMEYNSQFMTAPWWEQQADYDRNSPIEHVTQVHTPLLLAHGDIDRTVPFSQSMEMFIALRRLQRQAVLLHYVGRDHLVDDHPDLLQRQQQLFDHYLKDMPAPRWWADGVSYFKGQAPEPTMTETSR